MIITFVKPNIGRLEHSLYVDEGRMEPLQLGVLAGLTPADVECRLYDDRIASRIRCGTEFELTGDDRRRTR